MPKIIRLSTSKALFLPILQVVLAVAATDSATPITPESFAATQFDFIIVGGGTAGLVVANRLSEENVTVGVIDAGTYRPDDKVINDAHPQNVLGDPRVGTALGNATYDWRFESIPQAGLNGGTVPYPRGKVLGGSSALNSMVWQRGAKDDYDAWAYDLGNGEGWSFESLLPYFEKTENWSPPSPSEYVNLTNKQLAAVADVHGEKGHVAVSYNNYFAGTDLPMIEAAVNLGLKLNPNTDDGYPVRIPATTKARSVNATTGTRCYAATAYYDTEARSRGNLVVLTEALATKLVWTSPNQTRSTPKAVGVQYVVGNTTYTVNVTKEVIVSAGSIKSPQFLELSGVGNSTLLQALGIPVMHDLPQVGENFHDHAVGTTDFRVTADVITLDWIRFNQTYVQEQEALVDTNHTGAFTFTPNVDGAISLTSFINETQLKVMRADLDSYIATTPLTGLQKAQYEILQRFADSGVDGWLDLSILPQGGLISAPETNRSYYTAGTVNLHPFSRGSVHINTTDPSAPPVIDPKYFDVPFDLEVVTRANQYMRKWASTPPLSDIVDAWYTPNSSVTTDEQWVQATKQFTGSLAHPMGTLPMASQNLGGVVDPRLKVYGIANVRVVDASVIPLAPTAALQPTVYAIAEKASDMIKQDWTLPIWKA